MRDILFRGKRVDNGEWVYGYFVKSDGEINIGKCYILPTVADFSYGDNGNRIRIGCFVEVLPDTVGQYTCLKDKNGFPVYESDILFDEFGENYCVVKFGKYASPMGSDRFTANVGFYTAWVGKYQNLLRQDLGYWLKSMEETTSVVGNIYDNPDMLTGDGEV